MFGKNGSKPGPMCTVCMVVQWVIAVVILLGAIASVIGVYKAHFLVGGATFGTTNGSLALIAMVVSLAMLMKVMMCCPCRIDKK